MPHQETARTPTDERDLRVFWALAAAALTALLVAGVSGLALAIVDPDDGSTSRDVLRTLAATSGLATGALAGAAAIWAQVRNLWRFAPLWFRYLAWGVLVVVAVAAIISSAASS